MSSIFSGHADTFHPGRNQTGAPLAGCLLLIASLSVSAPTQAAAERPNIVFIMADDLGYGGIGCYGQSKIQTPHVDRLAAQGMRFTQAYAGSHVCQPSRSVLMTGLHTGHTPVRANDVQQYLQDGDVTIAKLLQKVGYKTGGFGKWGLGYEGTPGHPNNQGFDLFVGQYLQVHAHFHYPFWIWRNGDKVAIDANRTGRNQYVNDLMHAEALRFIKENAAGPFFAYLPYIIPHVELVVPEDSQALYRGRFPKVAIEDTRPNYLGSDDGLATYAGMVSRLDRYVGDVMALLEELKISDNTIVIFTSDNGGHNGGRDGGWTKMTDFFQGNGPFRGYKGTFYEGGLRVPFVVRWPAHVQPGSESPLIIGFQDLLPTFCEVAGIAVPTGIDGISFVPTLTAQGEQRRHDGLYWEYAAKEGINRAARMGDWKIIQTNGGRKTELYNLATDPGETTNAAQGHPQLVAKLTEFLDRSHTPPRPLPGPAVMTGVRDYVAGPWLKDE